MIVSSDKSQIWSSVWFMIVTFLAAPRFFTGSDTPGGHGRMLRGGNGAVFLERVWRDGESPGWGGLVSPGVDILIVQVALTISKVVLGR